uniref:Putative NB-ARC domain-containing disease resistance protein isoform 1 n=1 Tax=Davidia involucrata TaxID=16924 RepID=A0A5B7A169_DAVIN
MAEVAAAVATAAAPVIAQKVVEGGVASYAWLKEIFASSKNMEETVQHLKEAVTILGAKRDDYQNKVNRSKTKKASETYTNWLSRMTKIENEVKKLVIKYEKESERPPILCVFPRSNFDQEMKNKGEKVVKLLEEVSQFREILVDPPPERVLKMSAPAMNGTHKNTLDKIVNWLKDDNVEAIGIHGKLGIGKTAIMRNLNNHEVAEIFDIVIWLQVSIEERNKNVSREHLQQAIMERLNIEGTNNADQNANRISKELEDKKYLLLLDDVSEELDLSQLGIPVPDNENGCKIVLTARLGLVVRMMGVSQIIEVTSLSEDESWKMFIDVLRCPKLINDSQKGRLAVRICKECGGHPFLIEKVAKTFRVKNGDCHWAAGLDSYKMWSKRESQGMSEFYNLLEKYCYDELDDDQKKCFLYCALYLEASDIYTDYLLECWEAENFLKRENPYVNGHAILDYLKDASLLEEGRSREYVMMDKFFRQVAFHISSNYPECKYLVKTGGTLREPPDVESWSQKNRISLIQNKFENLPNCPNCSMLSTLFVQKNSYLKVIPKSFFDDMENLKVLDLSDTGIRSLPPSLSKLINLKVLNVSECKYLVELAPQIGKLEHLETLDIRGIGVNIIPPHVENLACLRHLRVSFTKSGNGNDTQRGGFNHDIISKLSRLEALGIDVKSLEHWSNNVVEEIIKEVATLENFKSLKFFFSNEVVNVIEVVPTTLRVYLPEASILQTFIQESSSWRNFQDINSFQFFIGCEKSEDPQIPEVYRYERYVKYCDDQSSNPSILKVLDEADAFELVNHKDIKQLSDFAIASMNQVRGCLVKSCDTIETIVGVVDSVVLQNLEHLYVISVPKLESIWKGPMRSGSLSNLETLVLRSCPMLIKIFPHRVIQQLNKIQSLEIEDCSEIEEIILEAEIDANLPVLPELKKLTLVNLPKLKSIYANESLEWPSLEELEISKCPTLHKLPFNKDNAVKLNSIKAEKVWWEALQWQNEEVKQLLQKSCILSS